MQALKKNLWRNHLSVGVLFFMAYIEYHIVLDAQTESQSEKLEKINYPPALHRLTRYIHSRNKRGRW